MRGTTTRGTLPSVGEKRDTPLVWRCDKRFIREQDKVDIMLTYDTHACTI